MIPSLTKVAGEPRYFFSGRLVAHRVVGLRVDADARVTWMIGAFDGELCLVSAGNFGDFRNGARFQFLLAHALDVYVGVEAVRPFAALVHELVCEYQANQMCSLLASFVGAFVKALTWMLTYHAFVEGYFAGVLCAHFKL